MLNRSAVKARIRTTLALWARLTSTLNFAGYPEFAGYSECHDLRKTKSA